MRLDGQASAFFHDVEFADSEVVEFFQEAAGPADVHGIQFSCRAETEVNTHVVVRIVAGAAADFVDEKAGAGFYSDASADGVSIGPEFLR